MILRVERYIMIQQTYLYFSAVGWSIAWFLLYLSWMWNDWKPQCVRASMCAIVCDVCARSCVPWIVSQWLGMLCVPAIVLKWWSFSLHQSFHCSWPFPYQGGMQVKTSSKTYINIYMTWTDSLLQDLTLAVWTFRLFFKAGKCAQSQLSASIRNSVYSLQNKEYLSKSIFTFNFSSFQITGMPMWLVHTSEKVQHGSSWLLGCWFLSRLPSWSVSGCLCRSPPWKKQQDERANQREREGKSKHPACQKKDAF